MTSIILFWRGQLENCQKRSMDEPLEVTEIRFDVILSFVLSRVREYSWSRFLRLINECPVLV